MAPARPPSIDALARSMHGSGLPHAVCVHLARQLVVAGGPTDAPSALATATAFHRSLLGPVINATGVLLHTNLGRAPMAMHHDEHPMNLELDVATGRRGSRHAAVGSLLATLCGAEAAIVVNNNAAAVLLVLAALAADRQVLVSRGESVEIGGGFRIPEVMEQSGARLIDVGTTNRTRLADYRKALARKTADVALTLKVHPSNYRVDGFVETTSVEQLAGLAVPVVADLGSGLVDATCPWLPGAPPAWLAEEPAARQTLQAGAAIVTFSGDKLFGGPQCGVIAGRADLVAACAAHPLARALRPGGHVLFAVQRIALSYLDRSVIEQVPFWRMVAQPVDALRARAADVVAAAGVGEVGAMQSVPGAGSAPGATIDSAGIVVQGDLVDALRGHDVPVIARNRDGRTWLDLRTVAPDDDANLVAALRAAAP